jgi:hypothetical protein
VANSNLDKYSQYPLPLDSVAHIANMERHVESQLSRRWPKGCDTEVFLHRWKHVVSTIGTYSPLASPADEYYNDLVTRKTLARILKAAEVLEYWETLQWLNRVVDEIDSDFMSKSTPDPDGLLQAKEGDNPCYWFLRRLPRDQVVVEHLLRIKA